MSGSLKQEEHSVEAHFSDSPPPTMLSVHNHDVKQKYIFFGILIAAEVIGIACVSLMIVWVVMYQGGLRWSGSQKFNYHPTLLAIGLIYLYANAILVFRVLPSFPKKWLKIIHASLNGSVIVITVVGMVAVFQYKKSIGKDDMYSLHSWIGMSALILFGLQYLVGLGSFLLPWTPPRIRALTMPLHRYFGVGIFTLVIATALTGTMEKLMWTDGYGSTNFNAASIIGNSYGLLLVVFAFLVVYLAVTEKYKRQPRPEDATGASKTYVVTMTN